MTVRPVRLNAVIAWLFILGSACFVLGSVAAYVSTVGGPVDGVTYVAGSVSCVCCSLISSPWWSAPGTEKPLGHEGQPRRVVRRRG